MAGQVELADGLVRNERQVVAQDAGGVGALVHGADVDVVEVEQHAAAGPADECAQELGFGQGRGGELQVGGGIVDQQAPVQHPLGVADIGRDHRQGLLSIGQGQEVRQSPGPGARGGQAPGQVIGHQAGADAALQIAQATQMLGVEAAARAQGHPHRMQRDGIAVGEGGEVVGAALGQVVLWVGLQPRHLRTQVPHGGVVGQAQPDSGGCRNGPHRRGRERGVVRERHGHDGAS